MLEGAEDPEEFESSDSNQFSERSDKQKDAEENKKYDGNLASGDIASEGNNLDDVLSKLTEFKSVQEPNDLLKVADIH